MLDVASVAQFALQMREAFFAVFNGIFWTPSTWTLSPASAPLLGAANSSSECADIDMIPERDPQQQPQQTQQTQPTPHTQQHTHTTAHTTTHTQQQCLAQHNGTHTTTTASRTRNNGQTFQTSSTTEGRLWNLKSIVVLYTQQHTAWLCTKTQPLNAVGRVVEAMLCHVKELIVSGNLNSN